MAKKSFRRGRVNVLTIAQWTKPVKVTENPGPYDTIREQVHYALRSDRHLLRRLVVWFRPGPYDGGKDVRHDYGWKEWKKIPGGVDPLTFTPPAEWGWVAEEVR